MRGSHNESLHGEEDDSGKRKSATPACRICHGGDNLIRACECRGSCAFVHAACLEMWVAHRQSGGAGLAEATTCELCLSTVTHRLQRQYAGRFLFSRDAWRAWLHLAYLGYCCKRLFGGGGAAMARDIAAVGRVWQRGRSWSRIRKTATLNLHYWLLFVIDARILLSVFKKWRDLNTKVVVRDRDAIEDGASEAGCSGRA